MSRWVDVVWYSPFMWQVLPPSLPSWELSDVLKGVVEPPFESLESAPERFLMLKVTLVLVLTSLKHVGDSLAVSVSESCIELSLGLVKAFLSPRPGYVPKVLFTPFCSQVVVLQAFSPSSSSEHSLLCQGSKGVCGQFQSLE